MLCYALLYYATLCYAMLCYALLYCAMARLGDAADDVERVGLSIA